MFLWMSGSAASVLGSWSQLWLSVFTCLSLQLWGLRFALWPLFSDGSLPVFFAFSCGFSSPSHALLAGRISFSVSYKDLLVTNSLSFYLGKSLLHLHFWKVVLWDIGFLVGRVVFPSEQSVNMWSHCSLGPLLCLLRINCSPYLGLLASNEPFLFLAAFKIFSLPLMFSIFTTMYLFIKIQWVSLQLSYFEFTEHAGWIGYCSSINLGGFQPLSPQTRFLPPSPALSLWYSRCAHVAVCHRVWRFSALFIFLLSSLCSSACTTLSMDFQGCSFRLLPVHIYCWASLVSF